METVGKYQNTARPNNKRKGYKKTYNINSKNIKSIVSKMAYKQQETKSSIYNTDTTLTTVGTLHELTAISQGTSQAVRIGNLIKKTMLWFNFKLDMTNTAHTTRVTLFHSIGSFIPTTHVGVKNSDMWDLDDMYILYDASFLQTSSTDHKVINVNKKIPLHYKGHPTKTTYTGVNATDAVTGRIWLWIRSDSDSSGYFAPGIRLFFKDA